MDEVVKIYLDSMVEVDRWISSESRDDEEEDDPGGGVQGDYTTPSGDQEATANAEAGEPPVVATPPPPKKWGPGKQKEPNFCKSNSLGILSAAFMHWFLGPAQLHWEGSWLLERKIQPAKGEMPIKRSNADWQTIILSTLWRQESITILLERLCGNDTDDHGSRDLKGKLRVYKNRETLSMELSACKPMWGLLGEKTIWFG
jgi:hypothetical protein